MEIKVVLQPNEEACEATIAAPPINFALSTGLTTTDGSSLDIPKASQLIYSSIIISPITQTFTLEKFLTSFLIF